MKSLTTLLASLCLCGWIAGCAPEAAPTTPAPVTTEDHGHDHAEGEAHEHTEGEVAPGESAPVDETVAPAETPEAGSGT